MLIFLNENNKYFERNIGQKLTKILKIYEFEG